MSAAPSPYDDFAAALTQAFSRLSPQQQLIAQYVMEHPDDFALGTAATVAEAAGVQPSALVRFANVLGYAGFSDLQLVFKTRLLQRASSYRERIDAMRRSGQAQPINGGQGGVLHQFVEEGVADLQQLGHDVGASELGRAADLICDASRVHVLAQRRAFPVAAYLSYALAQLDLRAQLLDGVGGMLDESLRQIDRGDLLIVASFKNYSPQVVQAAERAHAAGVVVLAITDHALSPLKPASTLCFELGHGPSSSFRSLVAPMCLAQAMVVSAGQRLVGERQRSARATGRGKSKHAR